jgi:hypothetical protein
MEPLIPELPKVAYKNDRRVTLKKHARAHGVFKRMINLILRHDLNLTKKSARWVPKLLTDYIKERVRTSKLFLAMVCHHSMLIRDNTVTMDISVSFHTQRQSSSQCSGSQRDSLGLGRPRCTRPGPNKWSWHSWTPRA